MWCPAGRLIHTPSRATACSATCIGFPCRDPALRAGGRSFSDDRKHGAPGPRNSVDECLSCLLDPVVVRRALKWVHGALHGGCPFYRRARPAWLRRVFYVDPLCPRAARGDRIGMGSRWLKGAFPRRVSHRVVAHAALESVGGILLWSDSR